MNEEQARAIDIGIRAICGATHSATKEEAAFLLRARRTLERMLSEGFVPCKKCGRAPTPFAMLVESDGWCAVCHCTRNNVYGRSLDDVRKRWNEEVVRMTESDVIPFLTHEWRPTLDIARDVYEAEGRRGGFTMVRTRIAHTLSMMEKRGKAESRRQPTRGRPIMWRLAE